MNLKEVIYLAGEKKNQYYKSLVLMDTAIGDFRKTAENLIPEALIKFELKESLRNFRAATQLLSRVKITWSKFGEVRILNSSTEVYIYRIVQELVNNAIKHASASSILVQLTYNTNRTGITVEDHGKFSMKKYYKIKKAQGCLILTTGYSI